MDQRGGEGGGKEHGPMRTSFLSCFTGTAFRLKNVCHSLWSLHTFSRVPYYTTFRFTSEPAKRTPYFTSRIF